MLFCPEGRDITDERKGRKEGKKGVKGRKEGRCESVTGRSEGRDVTEEGRKERRKAGVKKGATVDTLWRKGTMERKEGRKKRKERR